MTDPRLDRLPPDGIDRLLAIMAALRDPATLAPRAWLLPTQVQAWSGTNQSYRASNNPVTRVLEANARNARVESAGGLSLLQFDAAGAVTESAVSGLTASTGWQTAGFDAQWFFAWRSSGSAPSRSCTLAGCTNTASSMPMVSVSRWRLRPTTFLPAS